MLQDGWLSRTGIYYEAWRATHSTEAKKICGALAATALDAEKMLEEQGWVRIRQGIPFYDALISPSDIQKQIIINAYCEDIEHYRNMCKCGAAVMFSRFFEDEDYDKLKRGEL